MRIIRYIPFIALAALTSCGGAAQGEASEADIEQRVEEVVVNYDSLFAAMDVRYNALCAERRQAYAERDAERRRELIEANDRACHEFDDSLQRFIKEYNRE